jgi:ethanolamine utilization protein EutA
MSSYKTTLKEKDVVLLGLDFGSTTSSAMVAVTQIGRDSATGRMAFESPDIIFRSEPIFTPFDGERINEINLQKNLDNWLAESGVSVEKIFSGGAIITGLAAEKSNAGVIAELVKKRVGDTIIATASDPSLESWLAFMGSCSAISRSNDNLPVINLDIGGGTTNAALGMNGSVLGTGCYFIGARHFQFEPGTYRLTSISGHGQILMDQLGIPRKTGDLLELTERNAILDFYVDMLEAIVNGNKVFLSQTEVNAHVQLALSTEDLKGTPAVTFSGGVGELIYQYTAGHSLPETTYFGDLGIDLSLKIMASPYLTGNIKSLVPENMGRATVYGLAIHSTEISGSSLFIPKRQTLPLRDLPIVGRMNISDGTKKIRQFIRLVNRSSNGAAIQIVPSNENKHQKGVLNSPFVEGLSDVKNLGLRIRDGILAEQLSLDKPLILIVPYNYGKSLGNYATDWQNISVNLVVIDEIPDRRAHFVSVGQNQNNIIPVSFYGVK